jgi:dUTP pyrophosphatase
VDPAVPLPDYQTPGAAGFDLAASQDVTIEPGAVVLIPTGLVIQAPPGHCLGIFARSSTPLKKGLMVANGVGVIDEDYCGPKDEIRIQVLNFTPNRVEVKRGDRIAQGVFIPVTRAAWQEESGDLRQGSRGGFGATG